MAWSHFINASEMTMIYGMNIYECFLLSHQTDTRAQSYAWSSKYTNFTHWSQGRNSWFLSIERPTLYHGASAGKAPIITEGNSLADLSVCSQFGTMRIMWLDKLLSRCPEGFSENIGLYICEGCYPKYIVLLLFCYLSILVTLPIICVAYCVSIS